MLIRGIVNDDGTFTAAIPFRDRGVFDRIDASGGFTVIAGGAASVWQTRLAGAATREVAKCFAHHKPSSTVAKALKGAPEPETRGPKSIRDELVDDQN